MEKNGMKGFRWQGSSKDNLRSPPVSFVHSRRAVSTRFERIRVAL
jgi:hypothetical protein